MWWTWNLTWHVNVLWGVVNFEIWKWKKCSEIESKLPYRYRYRYLFPRRFGSTPGPCINSGEAESGDLGLQLPGTVLTEVICGWKYRYYSTVLYMGTGTCTSCILFLCRRLHPVLKLALFLHGSILHLHMCVCTHVPGWPAELWPGIFIYFARPKIAL